MSTFDPSRDHGLIYGSTTNARFVQDGVLYDSEGNELTPDGMKVKGKTPKAELEARLRKEQEEQGEA